MYTFAHSGISVYSGSGWYQGSIRFGRSIQRRSWRLNLFPFSIHYLFIIEKGSLDVDVKMAGKAREKFQQIDAAGATPVMPGQNKKVRRRREGRERWNEFQTEPSKWDKKETSTAEVINRRVEKGKLYFYLNSILPSTTTSDSLFWDEYHNVSLSREYSSRRRRCFRCEESDE